MNEEIKQLAIEIHKPSFKRYKRRHVFALAPDDLWSADLVDMKNVETHNENIHFLLNIIDVYSRYGYSIPLKDKSSKTVLAAFKTIDRHPKLLWTDLGKEFFNKDFQAWCKEKDIHLYATTSELGSVFAERWNRTMKEAFYKNFSATQTKSYLPFLTRFVEHYNHTMHRSTKNTPDKLYNGGGVSKDDIVINHDDIKPKLKINDYVRLNILKNTFEKGYTNRWTYETYKISGINVDADPPMYELEDLKGEKLHGRFYPGEIMETKVPFVKIIKDVLKTKKDEVLVSYEGWDKKFNEWISKEEYDEFLKIKANLAPIL